MTLKPATINGRTDFSLSVHTILLVHGAIGLCNPLSLSQLYY